ncbi:hypothetical protein Q0Z83_041760 [Actinoplanes sichuanensis]|uniref:Uncharacterized protein n=1 Tax=Actinoplanes sichuanensis TaxID=512349 RepID=A0ABW4ALJ8_9ACTN|nr:hypothetical protein Q0Z83_041760 [Actinoplanes sichuanensis]
MTPPRFHSRTALLVRLWQGLRSRSDLLRAATSVVITPGYGTAVAQARYPAAELITMLFGDATARVEDMVRHLAVRVTRHESGGR